MSDLIHDLRQSVIPAGGVRLYWLGRAGFTFQTASGPVQTALRPQA